MIKTAITEMFGVKYPIICGGMIWLCNPQFCATISNAGGLGNLTAEDYVTEDDFRGAIHETKRLTDKPFIVNISLLPSIKLIPANYQMHIKVCAEEQVAGIEISGAPLDKVAGMESIEVLKKAGVKLFQKVGSVRHALHAEKAGYDGIYAGGFEVGGHPLSDDVSTMVLTSRIVESVKIPVVTAGGIADGRTMAAALTLGAQGVMMASRFISTKECRANEKIKMELVNRQEHETMLFGKSIGLQGRSLKSKTIENVIAIEESGAGLEKLFPLINGERIIEALETGNVEYAPLMVGQSIGLIKDIPSCKELLERMSHEAENHISKAHGLMTA